MKFISLLVLVICFQDATASVNSDSSFFRADHPNIQFTGRVDFSDVTKPTFWAPGVYISIRFNGTYCVAELNDEERWGKSHNYIEIKVDDQPAYRIQTKGKNNRIVLASGLKKGNHSMVICKNTEAEIGYLQLVGFTCKKLLSPPKKLLRKIEFIGNSITCGMGNDDSAVPCNSKEWYDQHNAYMAYGPLTARNLKAQWQLSSVSGIGLIHSCCNKTSVMPQVFDKINMTENTLLWNFKNYQPDVLTVCLGQNDGIQDSTAFCNAYIKFLTSIRSYYPKTRIVLLSSPMAGPGLDSVLKKYILAVKLSMLISGDKKVTSYFFSKRYYKGCDSHPNAEEHREMAKELSLFLQKRMNW